MCNLLFIGVPTHVVLLRLCGLVGLLLAHVWLGNRLALVVRYMIRLLIVVVDSTVFPLPMIGALQLLGSVIRAT